MKCGKLAELNFRRLLHYDNQPDTGTTPSGPTSCTGFCVSCEKNGFLDGENHRLDQMSHGADTDDFERAICKLTGPGVDIPVSFLLESPGGYYQNGCQIKYEGITKQPPVNHYYWTPRPRIAEWPTEPSKIDPRSYGPYFAYIIATHKLHNAYFTNIVKCSLARRDADQFIPFYPVADPNARDSKIRANCYELFLSEEMRIVNPKIVFYFGRKGATMG
jgi:hypothetical protein